MQTNKLTCHYCGEENQYVPIIEKPKRYEYKGTIRPLTQINNDGQKVDRICLRCLSEEIDAIKDDY